MNKKAFTVVELIVTFALTMTIAVFLFQIIMALKDLYISYGTKTELLNKQSLISYQINNAFSNKKIKNITKCGSYCLNFIYDDDSTDKLFLDKDNLVFQFGDYKVILPDGSSFGDIDVNVYISPVFDSNHNDSILSINIAIYNSLLKNQNFGVSAVYQYNSLNSNITKVVFDSNESEYGAILLKGNIQTSAYNDETYTDAGYTLLDKDGNVITNPSLVTIDNPFSSMSAPYKAGKYDIKYYYKDASGNVIDIKTRTVTINDHIKLELVGDNKISVAQNSSYADSGYNVVDGSGNVVDISNYDGYLVNTTNNVNTSVAGTYVVTYTLTYNGEDVSICTRTVNVLYKDASGANTPVLYTNMIPVRYNGTNWVYANVTQKWYDYDTKEWANVVVLKSGVTKSAGDTIDVVNDVSQMYVWIPRYKYTIFNGNNGSAAAQQINVTFESGTASTGTVTCTDAVAGSGSSSETCSTITNGTSTYTHPAFKFGTTSLTGFWVGKFETGNVTTCTATSGSVGTACDLTTLGIQIKPNVTSWRGARVSTFYTAIASISTTYGINADSHMMKNMEWGAVAYLKQSKYGLSTTDIGINNYSGYMTGCGAAAGSSSSSTCNTYNTTGVVASTTGNIYGVYDMSGGAWEYVMGDMVTSGNVPMVGYNSTYNSGFTGTMYSGTWTGTTFPTDSKYYDKYTYDSSSNITHSRGKLGDATKETLATYGNSSGGWYSDYAYFPYFHAPWFLRGGNYVYTSGAGVFDFNYYCGDADTINGVRVVLAGGN